MPRKQKRYHYIYKTTNLINSKFYVGMHSTEDLNDQYLGSGKYLKNSINKYGKENFKIEILEFFESRDELVEREIELVNECLLKDPMCMNLKIGGRGGFTTEQRITGGKNMMEKSWKNPIFVENVKKRSSDTLKKSHSKGLIKGLNWTGRKHLKRTKKKMSNKAKLRIGEKNSQFGTYWIHNTKENKKIKKETLDFFLKEGWIKGRI